MAHVRQAKLRQGSRNDFVTHVQTSFEIKSSRSDSTLRMLISQCKIHYAATLCVARGRIFDIKCGILILRLKCADTSHWIPFSGLASVFPAWLEVFFEPGAWCKFPTFWNLYLECRNLWMGSEILYLQAWSCIKNLISRYLFCFLQNFPEFGNLPAFFQKLGPYKRFFFPGALRGFFRGSGLARIFSGCSGLAPILSGDRALHGFFSGALALTSATSD